MLIGIRLPFFSDVEKRFVLFGAERDVYRLAVAEKSPFSAHRSRLGIDFSLRMGSRAEFEKAIVVKQLYSVAADQPESSSSV